MHLLLSSHEPVAAWVREKHDAFGRRHAMKIAGRNRYGRIAAAPDRTADTASHTLDRAPDGDASLPRANSTPLHKPGRPGSLDPPLKFAILRLPVLSSHLLHSPQIHPFDFACHFNRGTPLPQVPGGERSYRTGGVSITRDDFANMSVPCEIR